MIKVGRRGDICRDMSNRRLNFSFSFFLSSSFLLFYFFPFIEKAKRLFLLYKNNKTLKIQQNPGTTIQLQKEIFTPAICTTQKPPTRYR